MRRRLNAKDFQKKAVEAPDFNLVFNKHYTNMVIEKIEDRFGSQAKVHGHGVDGIHVSLHGMDESDPEAKKKAYAEISSMMGSSVAPAYTMAKEELAFREGVS